MYFSYLATGVDIHPEYLRSIRLTGAAEERLRSAYGETMRREYADMPLSQRGGSEYMKLRIQRREDLEALLRHGIDASNREKAIDLICAICEENTWAESIPGVFDDDAHPAIDLMAAQTASLLAWTLHEGNFVTNVRVHILRELRRRIFTPLIAYDNYANVHPGAPRALSVVCETVFAALLAESDRSRLNSLLRRLTKLADELAALPLDRPLSEAIEDWVCAAALWRAAGIMTAPQPVARPLPRNAWLDTLLFAHLGDGLFVDPFGGGLLRGLNAADVYYLGKCAGDEAVSVLGASMYRGADASLSCLSARLTEDAYTGMRTSARTAPRFKHGAVEDASIMTARGGGVCVTVHTGGRNDSGAVCVYMDDAPVLFACDEGSVILNGRQLTAQTGAGECDFDDERADMSVDMTPAVSTETGVRFMQRTAMLERDTGFTRIIDVIECGTPGEVKYTFRTLAIPVFLRGGVRLGRCFMSWDEGAKVTCEKSEPDGIFTGGYACITLTYALNAGRNMFNFNLERA